MSLPDSVRERNPNRHKGRELLYEWYDGALSVWEGPEVMALVNALGAAHLKMDDANAEFGDNDKLCIFCDSAYYTGVLGLDHAADCVILQVREALAQVEEPALPVAPNAVTSHYELWDDGMYLVWGADFLPDEPGSRKLTDAEAANVRAMGEDWYFDCRTKEKPC